MVSRLGAVRAVALRVTPSTRVLTAVAGSIAALLGFVWALLVGNYDVFGAMLVFPALLVISVPIIRRVAAGDDSRMVSLLSGALIFKLVAAVIRYKVAYGVYGGVADASTYHGVAMANYQEFRRLHLFSPDTSVFHGFVPFLNTVIYAVIGPTQIGAFLIFSWLGFLGLCLFYLAFRRGIPGADHWRYALLLFFLPSLLYWPSSVGKEAWMIFALGLASLGAAHLVRQRRGGFLLLGLGLWAMMIVRPHMALVVVPAVAAAYLLRRSARTGTRLGWGKLVGLVILAAIGVVVVAKAQSYLGITSLDSQSVNQTIDTVRSQTAEGRSQFAPPDPRSPAGYVVGFVTMAYRPLPIEVHGFQAAVSSAEGVFLIGATLAFRRSLWALPRMIRRQTYVLYVTVYCALFVFAFSSVANFGILARERVQFLPLALTLLCLPAQRTAQESAPADARTTTEERSGAIRLRTRRAPDAGR